MVAIDIFSGAGGMSVGARSAGIDVQIAVEADPWAALTYAKNHPEVRMFNGLIEHFSDFSVQRARDEPTLLFGGPPCQGFSTSNQKTRSGQNRTNWLYQQFLRVAKTWRPDWIVFENVKGITETEGGRFLKIVLRRLHTIGYRTTVGVLNSADFGVPQRRNRLFVVGWLHGEAPDLPSPKACAPVTVREALSDLPCLPVGADCDRLKYKAPAVSTYAKRLRKRRTTCTGHLVTLNGKIVVERFPYVPPGGNWEDIPKRLMHNYSFRSEHHTGVYHRLELDKPSVVLGNYRKNMLIHPSENRGLSVREASRLQSFPDAFEFVGSIGFQQQQVSNAVPPMLAESVFEAILRS
jgi:DNA (cytosine-5)-methyltransferase 1